ncbi:serine hydrolase [Microbulbifer guangxiensis]|uniref:serine hydrolase n=1 Tax=Microbulbifer guangxiensis TaxID=2904249 RepID=UPI001F2099F1|nr:serine hydrolase [Microbulbifer guangxiensis]
MDEWLIEAGSRYPTLTTVMANPEPYRLQILYTQIDREADNQPVLREYQYGVDENRYFYPASTVKLPISLLALEWLAEQDIEGLTSGSGMLTDAAEPFQTVAHSDPSAESGIPSIAHYIKKILLVSDNDASNRLYELLGQDYINQKLADKGLQNTLINHRLSTRMSEEENRQYNPIRFVGAEGEPILSLPARYSETRYINAGRPKLGSAHIASGERVEAPMDFTTKNRLSLGDLDGVLKRLVFPQLFAEQERFNLRPEDRALVLRYMSMLPPDSDSPTYDPEEYPQNYAKFLMYGGEPREVPGNIKIFNKTGWAYGHVIDSAYIVDTRNQVEFFLSAVIYANENDTLNDDQYQIDEVAKPFLRELGSFIYENELKRNRPSKPDLSAIRKITGP